MGRNSKLYTLAATALGSSLAFIDATAVIVALPTMQKDLNLGLSGQQWIFLSYSLALASLYLIGGGLGDRYGHAKVFKYGIAGFALASLLAGLAPSGGWIIAARVFQGVSGAFVTTNSLAWLRSAYAENAGRAVGLWTSLTGVSTVLAPLLGGILTQWFSWRLIFFINLPLAALVIFWANRAIDKSAKPPVKRPVDIWGGITIAASLSFLTYFLVQGPDKGFANLWWLLAAGLGALMAFVLIERKSADPMLPFKLFRIRNFSFANLETFLIYGALNGVFVYFVLYLQFLGLSPVSSSLFLVPASLALITLAAYFGAMADRTGARYLLTAGPALIGLGCLSLAGIGEKADIWLWGSFGIVLFSIGLAMLVAPITATALKSAPDNFAGIASGVNNTMSRIGGLTTVALVGAVISVIFINSTGGSGAVPLEAGQAELLLREASVKAFRISAIAIAGLAFCSAAVGWFGIANDRRADKQLQSSG